MSSWPRHKAWHKEQKQISKLVQRTSDAQVSLKDSARTNLVNHCYSSSREHEELMLKRALQHERGNLRKEAKLLKRAIQLEPNGTPWQYAWLGDCHDHSNDVPSAYACYMKAVEVQSARGRWDERSCWAECLGHAFSQLIQHKELARPMWWNDTELMSLSKELTEVIEHAGLHDYNAFQMRAIVLGGGCHTHKGCGWSHRVRTVDELRAAAACWRTAASHARSLGDTGSVCEMSLLNAQDANRMADERESIGQGLRAAGLEHLIPRGMVDDDDEL